MIDIQSIKLLMAGRAGVYGLLADIFTAPADMEDIYNLCKYLYDLTESVEVIDENEEILQGFKGLALWYENAQKAEKSWVETKLKEEFISVFKNPAGSIGIIFPNQDGRGAHINVSGIAMTASSKNQDAAKKFMEFMLSKDVQTMLTNINYEFPVRSDVVPSDIVKEFGKFKEDSVEVSKIAENVKDAVLIYDEVGFR